VTGSYDRTIFLWDMQTALCLQNFVGHHDFVYSVALANISYDNLWPTAHSFLPDSLQIVIETTLCSSHTLMLEIPKELKIKLVNTIILLHFTNLTNPITILSPNDDENENNESYLLEEVQ